MRFLLIISMVFMFSAPALAQSYTEMYEQVTTINRVDPLQNPSYKRTYQILNRKVQDRKTKVVGEVKDVLITKFGPVQALNIDLNRLRLGLVTINLADANIVANRDAYAFANYDEEGIKDLYPQLLANIQTAAGDDADVVSLQKLLGATVKNKKGEVIGKVNDVLFSSNGNAAQALYVDVQSNAVKGDVAIPFGAADYAQLGTDNQITVFDDQARAMTDYIKAKK